MTRRSFRETLRAADDQLGRDGMPPEVDRRLRERLEQARRGPLPASSLRAGRWLIAGALAASAAVAVVIMTRHQRPAMDAGFEVVAASADLRVESQAGGVLAVLAGTATVRSDETEIVLTTQTPVRLRSEPSGVAVLAGVVDISVAKRKPGQRPARVRVSHGAIEVMGTRFHVEQRADNGDVRLDEGSIVFTTSDGRQVQLAPGDSLHWPVPPAPARSATDAPAPPAPAPMQPAPEPAPPEPARPAPRPATTAKAPPVAPEMPVPTTQPAPTAPPPSVAQPALPGDDEPLLREVAELRARGQYRQAADALERRLAQGGMRAATEEILSFELATILTYQLDDAARACPVLRRHLREHPHGRYGDDVERARARLGCHDDH